MYVQQILTGVVIFIVILIVFTMFWDRDDYFIELLHFLYINVAISLLYYFV